MNFSELDRVVL